MHLDSPRMYRWLDLEEFSAVLDSERCRNPGRPVAGLPSIGLVEVDRGAGWMDWHARGSAPSLPASVPMWSTVRAWLEEWHILEKPVPPLLSLESIGPILRMVLVYTIRTAAFVFGVLPFLWLFVCECRGLTKLVFTSTSNYAHTRTTMVRR